MPKLKSVIKRPIVSARCVTLKVTFSIPYVILRKMTVKGFYATLNGL